SPPPGDDRSDGTAALCKKMMSFGISSRTEPPANPVDQLLARLTPGAALGSGVSSAGVGASSSAVKSCPLTSTTANVNANANAGAGANADILAKLSEQQLVLGQQQKLLAETQSRQAQQENAQPKPSSLSLVVDTDHRLGHPPALPRAKPLAEADGNQSLEMLRLKQELVAANSRIAFQEQELAHNRVVKNIFDQPLCQPPPPPPPPLPPVPVCLPTPDTISRADARDQAIGTFPSTFDSYARPFSVAADVWANTGLDATSANASDTLLTSGYNRTRGIWSNPTPAMSSAFGPSSLPRDPFPPLTPSTTTTDARANWTSRVTQPGYHLPGSFSPPPPRDMSNPREQITSYGGDDRYTSEQLYLPASGALRGLPPSHANRSSMSFPPVQSSVPWGTYPSAQTLVPRAAPAAPYYSQPMPVYTTATYQPAPIGTPLSPTAAEFTSMNHAATTPASSTLWDSSAATSATVQTYVSPMEPLNYRKLLEKNVSCDWKYIVDKIVCSNDQQASIFLQQKLKTGTVEQRYEIVESIVNQAYPLMVNRFGNFLVQRCFEHGTPEQIISIGNAMRGNTLNLSMDPFGCHVVQKAFDCVPEDYKAMMVHELLRRIPETVIHRYACHVWQKLFELRWSGEPPQIMAKVNEALRGMWHEVALGETGSLVVQNIFENCVEDEKRQAIEEVLAKIDLLAHGQFGNWCIQHICEHGAPQDRSRAMEHILANATEYSMDQFASKVVEKCLKI
ncbi:hypothetical protein KEM52_001965, partial [Ascosphaera acerosa]